MKAHAYVHWIALILGIILMMTLLCARRVVRKVPLNYILLVSFTLLWSYMVAGFTSYTDPKIVLIAAVCSATMFLGLSTMACCVKTEKFGYCFGFLSVLIALVLPAIIFSLLYPNKIVHTMVCVLLITLFSFYIIYDTK